MKKKISWLIFLAIFLSMAGAAAQDGTQDECALGPRGFYEQRAIDIALADPTMREKLEKITYFHVDAYAPVWGAIWAVKFRANAKDPLASAAVNVQTGDVLVTWSYNDGSCTAIQRRMSGEEGTDWIASSPDLAPYLPPPDARATYIHQVYCLPLWEAEMQSSKTGQKVIKALIVEKDDEGQLLEALVWRTYTPEESLAFQNRASAVLKESKEIEACLGDPLLWGNYHVSYADWNGTWEAWINRGLKTVHVVMGQDAVIRELEDPDYLSEDEQQEQQMHRAILMAYREVEALDGVLGEAADWEAEAEHDLEMGSWKVTFKPDSADEVPIEIWVDLERGTLIATPELPQATATLTVPAPEATTTPKAKPPEGQPVPTLSPAQRAVLIAAGHEVIKAYLDAHPQHTVSARQLVEGGELWMVIFWDGETPIAEAVVNVGSSSVLEHTIK